MIISLCLAFESKPIITSCGNGLNYRDTCKYNQDENILVKYLQVHILYRISPHLDGDTVMFAIKHDWSRETEIKKICRQIKDINSMRKHTFLGTITMSREKGLGRRQKLRLVGSADVLNECYGVES